MAVDKVVIMGAAGRDFHTFNTCFRDDPAFEVVGFTATQIPGIADRQYPAALSGERYPDGIPIYPEAELESLIRRHDVGCVVFAYSDVSHAAVMHAASRALACGADFRIVGSTRSSLSSARPVISVCAVRTGCGKGMVVRRLTDLIRQHGLQPVVVRHPMPYGDLARQAVQRFASLADCERHACSLEEREEYEQHLRSGVVVYAGVDYERILRSAEREADVIVWDGGNNDWPFFRSNLEIVLLDPHRAGHEVGYHPGETNVRRAQVLIVNKLDSAPISGVRTVIENSVRVNPHATLIQARSAVSADHPELIRGKRVLVIEDGPTLTHGEMAYGSGVIAARRYGAREIVDPRPYAQGSLAQVLAEHPWIHQALPAVGYSQRQLRDLADSVARVPCDALVIATPVDLARVIPLAVASCRVRYDLEEVSQPGLSELIDNFVRTVVGR